MKIQEERNKVDNWLKVIADYLLTRDDIKDSLDKENKSLEECGNYILQEAQKKGSRVAMTDEEVFGLAVHYYDEDDITVKHTSKADVKVAAQKDDKPLKPLAEYRKEIDQTESNFIDKKTGKPIDIDKIVEKRVKKKLAEIKKTEQEKKEKRKATRKAKKPKVNQVSLFDL
jgi:hypothetical protein